MATPQAQAVRRWILTGAVAAITVTGTIYGAGLKSDREVIAVRHNPVHASFPSAPGTMSYINLAAPLPFRPVTNSFKERKRYQQASPEEIISQLQIARDNLVMKKKEMERKIAGFHEKQRQAKELEQQQQQEREQREEQEREEQQKRLKQLQRPR
ncbi:uncharacterized protein EKO05_0006476 [Ascochyta rabiei]|uniref:Uncharacterized protein n=1 Tax=Didymella rabiei TaxID=5454 RepID=A0A162VYY6_DIDRA|nr:uncharacterized protein EKO05_0006476 [Ascochyta rabiei]KZM18680.1 hypothetical protein ST47_g10163 [Ascochyta rabiei]UPX16051.1 hypothetical protein EKO05_0006476 [Ascochyta rabiei]